MSTRGLRDRLTAMKEVLGDRNLLEHIGRRGLSDRDLAQVASTNTTRRDLLRPELIKRRNARQQRDEELRLVLCANTWMLKTYDEGSELIVHDHARGLRRAVIFDVEGPTYGLLGLFIVTALSSATFAMIGSRRFDFKTHKDRTPQYEVREKMIEHLYAVQYHMIDEEGYGPIITEVTYAGVHADDKIHIGSACFYNERKFYFTSSTHPNFLRQYNYNINNSEDDAAAVA